MIRQGAHCATCLPFFSTKPRDTGVRTMSTSLEFAGNINSVSSLNQKCQIRVIKAVLGNSPSHLLQPGV